MSAIAIKVPDIGDFKDVSVIELLVKPGDTVALEQSLITVESDKASMEIPSSHAGVVKEIKVALGDVVNQGSLILFLDPLPPAVGSSSDASVSAAPSVSVTPSTQVPASQTSDRTVVTAVAASSSDIQCDLVVLGGGPGGYSAAFRAADLGLSVVLVERYATLGGVCLNVGCIPSKALLHVASVMDEVKHLQQLGISYGSPVVDIPRLRSYKEKVIAKLTSGLASMAKMRKVTVMRGVGQFVDSHHLQVTQTEGSGKDQTEVIRVLNFQRAIIAAGSQAVHLPFLPSDPRVVDSTGALAMTATAKKMLIVGGGIIGLEMGTVYSTLGARLEVVEMLDGLMPGADRDLVKVWEKLNQSRFDRIMLKTKTVAAKATSKGIVVQFEGADGSTTEGVYDMVLQAVGRRPNGHTIGADKAGLTVTERGFISVDLQMRTHLPHIFAIGDIVGQPMLAHKAVHEAHVAAQVVAGELQGHAQLASSAFDARVIPSVAYTDPEIAWVGLTEEQAKAQGIAVKKGLFPWAASGRAIANGRDEGFTKLLFEDSPGVHGHGRILGGGIVGTHAGDLIGEVALAIEMQADAVDIGKTIHPHPTLGESIGLAAEAAHGSCTDLPPVKK